MYIYLAIKLGTKKAMVVRLTILYKNVASISIHPSSYPTQP